MYSKENLLMETKEMLDTVDDKTLLMVHAMLSVNVNNTTIDWWDEITNEQRHGLEISIAQADNGQVHSHTEALKILDKRR